MNRITRFRISAVTMLTAGHFFSDFYVTFLPALIPVFMDTMQLSIAASGLIVMFHSLTANILQPAFGYYVDKRGYAWLILATLPISAFFICFSGLVTSYPILILTVLASGLGVSLFHPLGSSLVTRMTVKNYRGLAMSIFIGGGNFGFALAPAIVTYWIAEYTVNSLPLLIIPGIIISLGFYRLHMHRVHLARRQLAPAGHNWYRSHSVLKLNLVMGLRSCTQIAVTTFLPLYLIRQGHSQALGGSMLTIFLTGGALGGLLGGYIGDRIGYRQCIIGTLAASLPCLYSLFVVDASSWYFVVMLGIAGAFLQGATPASIVWAQAILPDNKAMASGMMLGLSSGIGGLGTAIIGSLADHIGLHSALLWALLPAALAIPITYTITKQEKV